MNAKSNNGVIRTMVSRLLAHLVRPPRKPSKTTLIILSFLVFALAFGLIPRWLRQAQVKAETLASAVPFVTVTSPKLIPAGSGQALPAEIKPWTEAPIYARASGYLKQRFVDIGDRVEEGQLLAEIDTPELNQDLERARAVLAQAEVAQKLAKVTAERWANLRDTASVSEQENAEKQADFNSKAATAASARAEVHRLEELQAFSRVAAPFAGVITARNIDTGDLIVGSGGKELFHLAQMRKLRVSVQVPQAMASHIEPGQGAELVFPEHSGSIVPAKVIRTAGVIASDSRTLLVELEVDNPEEAIIAGSYAQARFPETKGDAVLTLPANAVRFRADGPQIAVVKPDNTVIIKDIKLGRDYGQALEIVAGVDSKDRVVMNPQDSLINGVAVAIADAASSQKKGKE